MISKSSFPGGCFRHVVLLFAAFIAPAAGPSSPQRRRWRSLRYRPIPRPGTSRPAFDHSHRDLAVRQSRSSRAAASTFSGCCTPIVTSTCILRESSPSVRIKAQRAVMDRILHGAHRGLRVVAAMQIVAGAHFEDHAFRRHAPILTRYRAARPRRHWRSRSSSCRHHWGFPTRLRRRAPFRVPCGSTARTASLST